MEQVRAMKVTSVLGSEESESIMLGVSIEAACGGLNIRMEIGDNTTLLIPKHQLRLALYDDDQDEA